ncbi:hypothetical protein H0H81_000132 [Sphagnurus paluster]|uniref:Uncharacterized protein n=1 Tax=Sphagnurus paluster TaxID=117069 RepID=A0A9P7GNN9_9AGAR|nr:hypothetical protein H0H81_000132 [Sphagnurus paluster]
MAPKRTLELAIRDSEEASLDNEQQDIREPPMKRRMTSIPLTPLPTRSFQIPQTPFTGTPLPARPLDSPTNPVGRKRTQVLTHSLPAPTSFSQHLPLRFQLVRPNVSPRMGGIYRIVQVPLSYTFVQLRCLIAFLFGGGYGDKSEDRHLFELKKKISLYAQTYKPGQIRTGFTTVRLSTARDPCRYRPEVEEDSLRDDNAGTQSRGATESNVEEDTDEGEGEDDGETSSWTWQLEEEYTLGHFWPRGGDLASGVIYHHNETTAVHITLNNSELPRRTGSSNTPYVFKARGRVRLLPHSALPFPKPEFSLPVNKLPAPSFRQSTWSVSRSESEDGNDSEADQEYGDMSSSGLFSGKGKDLDINPSEMSDSDDDEEQEGELPEDPNVMLPTDKFNAPHAFATYLRFVHQHSSAPPYPVSESSDTEDENAPPGLGHWSSSPASSPLKSSPAVLALRDSSSSSPFVVTSPSRSRSTSVLQDPYLAWLQGAPAFTPAPPQAQWQRRRLDRMQRRMEKYKRRDWKRAQREEEAHEELERLAEDAEAAQAAKAHLKVGPASWRTGKPSGMRLPPIIKDGVVWDPFGDECEV